MNDDETLCVVITIGPSVINEKQIREIVGMFANDELHTVDLYTHTFCFFVFFFIYPVYTAQSFESSDFYC